MADRKIGNIFLSSIFLSTENGGGPWPRADCHAICADLDRGEDVPVCSERCPATARMIWHHRSNANCRHVDTLQLLLSAGADCDTKFTHDAKTLLEWLAQYPNDPRYMPITETLRRHKAGA